MIDTTGFQRHVTGVSVSTRTAEDQIFDHVLSSIDRVWQPGSHKLEGWVGL
jgi:hypothetical protein